ncbi:MAG: peptidylprolyl isomerase [Candidatus Hydrogenedentes bacterium]|nr:peptidylprolyl isomerase [Candidatus Hydrogenedentota bacterium]
MTAEFQDTSEPKDRTRLIWGAIVIVVASMVAALWFLGRPDRTSSFVHVRHILIAYDRSDPTDRARALNEITELRQRLLNGEDFATLAQEYSRDPISRPRGGDLGYEGRGTYEKSFDEYVWAAPIGEISEIVTTSHGFHLIRVEERFISDADRYEMDLEQRAKKALEAEQAQQKATQPSAPPPPPALLRPPATTPGGTGTVVPPTAPTEQAAPAPAPPAAQGPSDTSAAP